MTDGLGTTLLGLMLLLAVGGALFAIALWAWTVRALTRPPRRGYAWALARQLPSHPGEIAEQPPQFTEWSFRSGGLEFPVWDITGRRTTGPTVILTPGWGQGRVSCLDRVEGILDHVSRVVVWDLPGTGEAPGRCSLGAHEPSKLRDLIDRVACDGKLVLMGASMGAGVSIEIAAGRDDIAGVIAEAPYRDPVTPALGVLRAANLPSALNLRPAIAWVGIRNGKGSKWSDFDRAVFAAKLRCPLLVLHGTADDVCPIEDGRAIASAAKDGTITAIPEGDHHALWREPDWRAACARETGRFLDQIAQIETDSP